MKDKEMLITRDDLLKFMSKDKYNEFIDYLVEKTEYTDYETIQDHESIFIIAQWGEWNLF